MDKPKLFKDLVVGDVIYGFKIDDQDYNTPGDICTVDVVDIDREDDLLTIYTSMKSGTSPSGNETYYVYFDTETDLSNDRQVDFCFATTEEEIKELHKECIEESINLHERAINVLNSLYLKHHGYR